MATRILVVDDDLDFARVLCRGLRAAGLEAQFALNGRAALKDMEDVAPDVLVTDMMMPEVDGVGLIAGARRRFPKLAIVAMSGSPQIRTLDLLDMAVRLGADTTLAKPFSTDELTEVVTRILGRRPR